MAGMSAVRQLSPEQLLREPPTGLTIAGDWHADGDWSRQVIGEAAAAGSQVVLHLGDFGVWPGDFGRRYLDTVEAALADTGLTLAFIDGNHEDFAQLLAVPLDPASGLRVLRTGLYHLPRGTRWNWHGVSWLAIGGASSIDRAWRKPGISWWPEEALTAGDVARAVAAGKADVMLTHDSPEGVAIPGISAPAGPAPVWPAAALAAARANRLLVREVVDAVRPTHLFHGHFHVRYTTALPLRGGSEVTVAGLDREGSAGNVVHLDPAALARDSRARRAAAQDSRHHDGV